MKNRVEKITGNQSRYAGYSFIEGIFATFIVTVGMIAVIQLMTANLTLMINSRNQTEAIFLAQEGAEIVSNIRDNNWAASKKTFDSSDFPAGPATCKADIYSTFLTCDNSDKRLKKAAPSGIYSYAAIGGAPSMFQREIMIDYNTGVGSSATISTVTSVVVWDSGNFPSNPPSSANCNLHNQCSFVLVTLYKWGGSD